MKIVLLSLAVLCLSAINAAEFQIGIYMANPVEEKTFAKLHDTGFNYVQIYGTRDCDKAGFDRTAAFLDMAAKYDQKVLFTLGARAWIKAGKPESVKQLVDRFKDHPAIGCWYLSDEPDGETIEKPMQELYLYVKQNDPSRRPVAIVTCWNVYWNRYQDCLDIHMVDHYPVKNAPFPNAKLGNLTTYLERVIALGKPSMPVIQAFSFNAYPHEVKGIDPAQIRYPDANEIRYMIWGSMAQGVPGIWFYSYYDNIKVNTMAQFEQNVVPAVRELKQFIAMVDAPDKPEVYSGARDDHFYLASWRAGAKTYFVAANAWPTESTLADRWLDGKITDDFNLQPWGSSAECKAEIRNGKLTVNPGFSPWEVRIWELLPVQK